MKTIVQNEVYGEIVYEESVWTGRKNLTINNVPLVKKDRKTFEYTTEKGTEMLTLKGNTLSGVKLLAGDQTITVIPAPKWYELALSVFIFVFVVLWGNMPTLCEIVPLVGGFIGAVISGIFGTLNIFIMRKTKKIYLKLLIFLGFFAATVLVSYLFALVIIMIMMMIVA